MADKWLKFLMPAVQAADGGKGPHPDFVVKGAMTPLHKAAMRGSVQAHERGVAAEEEQDMLEARRKAARGYAGGGSVKAKGWGKARGAKGCKVR